MVQVAYCRGHIKFSGVTDLHTTIQRLDLCQKHGVLLYMACQAIRKKLYKQHNLCDGFVSCKAFITSVVHFSIQKI